MTESEWLTCNEPWIMLNFLQDRERAFTRKLRLFACACMRHAMPIPPESRRQALEADERYADLGPAEQQSTAATRHVTPGLVTSPWFFAVSVAKYASERGSRPDGATLLQLFSPPRVDMVEAAGQAALLRCLIGNPFRPPPPIDAACLTPRVLSLANGIYERMAFDHLPELASLLEDAGCRNAELLGHLRGPGPHARGCHVLDAVLGRS
jgi:hypothetical protein